MRAKDDQNAGTKEKVRYKRDSALSERAIMRFYCIRISIGASPITKGILIKYVQLLLELIGIR